MNDLTIKSVATYFLTNLVGRILAAAGAALVAHGITTDDQFQQQIGPLTQEIVGGLLVLGAAAEAWIRAHWKRQKEEQLAVADPSSITVK